MPASKWIYIAITAVMLGGGLRIASAERPPANVPPGLEIEVLDPNADPQGRPAVELTPDGNGGLRVDIPPTVLVHRYYYNGDRSFQAQLLPGGPTILVVNHPKTGERCYINAQMMPGAPRVTYTSHGIEYDYGEHAVTLHFGWTGKPTVKYRSGLPLHKRVSQVFYGEEIQEHKENAVAHTKDATQHATKAMKGAIVTVGDASKQALLPLQNMLQLMPFGKALTSGDLGEKLEQRAAEYEREKGIRRTQLENKRNEPTFRTNR